jgi:hypothetical protein
MQDMVERWAEIYMKSGMIINGYVKKVGEVFITIIEKELEITMININDISIIKGSEKKLYKDAEYVENQENENPVRVAARIRNVKNEAYQENFSVNNEQSGYKYPEFIRGTK